MGIATGATPLIALDAVAIDTETTGLDTATARIVQLGAVAISKGRVESRQTLELLVDPQVSIPSQAARIHGISNAAVRNAPTFADAWARLTRFQRGRIVVGYSIGFDLAVLESEAKRAGAAWQKPRALCVRLLATIANSALPDHSLETIAAWLGVAITGRHQALGDAVAAAAVFVALLPKLQERGIRTLGQAERACLQLTALLEDGRRAGWADPVGPPVARPYGSVDPYAYRHRVRDVMSASPLVIPKTTDTDTAIRLMVENKIGSLFVSATGEPDRAVSDHGIVTERDIVRALARNGAGALAAEIGSLASRPLVSVRAEAFVYRAVGRMDRLKIRHLAVRDEAGRLVGVVSARDLLRLRATAAIQLDDMLEVAASPAEMAAAWASLPSVADRLIEEEIGARTVCEIVSEELHAATRRAAILAEAEMERDGHGPSPCHYALMVLGSGGRGESLLAADQDNAIVFEHGGPGGPEDRWFATLGKKLADLLDTVGVPHCKGGVMARNPEWRGSLDLWKSRIAEWMYRSRPQDLLNVDIFFDQRPVHGDHALALQLFDHAFAAGHAQVAFAKLLGEQLADIGMPFTLFGNLHTEHGRIDLKLHGLFPIVSMARTLAIRHDVRARSTKERLEGLMARDIAGEADVRRILSGHSLILSLLLAQQSYDLHAGLPASNKIEVGRLGRSQLAELKTALKDLQVIPNLVRDLMFG
jgi:DNA polymerase-3 subunit epsilon/CBS domain-containing protein